VGRGRGGEEWVGAGSVVEGGGGGKGEGGGAGCVG